MLFDGRRETADAGTDDDANFIAIFLFKFESGIQQRLPPGIETELRVAICAANFLWRRKCWRGIKIFHFASDFCVEGRRVERGDFVNAVLPGDQSLFQNTIQFMSTIGVIDAEAGNDYAAIR